MTDQYIELKGASNIKLVKEPGLQMIQRPGFRLMLNRGVAGKNGVDGPYNSPTPFPVVDGTTYVVPTGKKLDSISVVPAVGDRVLSVGYSADSGEVIDAEEIAGNDGASFPIGRYYHAGITLHFSGFTGQVLIYLL